LASEAHEDNKTLPKVVKSLGILKERDANLPVHSLEEVKKYNDGNPRYVRNKGKNAPTSVINKSKTENEIHSSTQKLVEGQISPNDFRKILRNNNINPEINEIKKLVQACERGDEVKYKDLAFAVSKFKTSNNVDSKYNLDFDPPTIFKMCDETDNIGKSSLIVGNACVYLSKKKNFEKNPTFHSNYKEVFDWDLKAEEDNSKNSKKIIDVSEKKY